MITGEKSISPSNNLKERLAIPKSNVKDAEYVCHLVTKEMKDWAQVPSIILADLANPPRDDLPNLNVICGLLTGLNANWWTAQPDGLAVVLLSRALSPDDIMLKMLKPHIDNQRLALIEPTGRITGTLPNTHFVAANYVQELKVAQEDPLTLIEHKMIRRIGYFKRPKSISGAHTKYFYDGSHCTSEILAILEAELDFTSVNQVLVHGPISTWLKKVSDPLAVKYSIETVDLQAVLEAMETSMALPIKLLESPIVLLPLVDTGDTLARIDAALSALNPTIKAKFISVLATARAGHDEPLPQGATAPRLRKRIIPTKRGPITFNYLLEVEQIYIPPDKTPSSLREHSGSSFDIHSESALLTSFAFWDMVETSGWKNEDDVPHPRHSLGNVPDFPEILKQNGPLLAFKIDKLLRDSRRGLPVDPIFVCPQEKGAIEVADSLSSMFGYSSIRIPRAALEDDALFADGPVQISALKARFSKDGWFSQLMSAGLPSARAILMDEFRVSGGTLIRLEAICRSAGLQVEKKISLADFGPGYHSDQDTIDTLYRIPLMEKT